MDAIERHLLLTISDDKAASYNLRFIRNFFTQPCALRLTLLYVAPPSAVISPFNRVQSVSRDSDEGTAVLEAAKERLTSLGCDPERIETKTTASHGNVTREIIHQARKGMYDAVVLGRRGLSWFRQMFDESVSKQLLDDDIDFPVWLCRSPVPVDRQRVLLCVDGSEPSFRMADHVGFILGNEHHHMVTIFHVTERPSQEADSVVEQARLLVTAGGFSNGNVTERVVVSGKTAATILQEMQTGKYGVAALGRAAESGGVFGGLFMDSVSSEILHNMDGFSLWISK